jgi:NAD+ diphosphatase
MAADAPLLLPALDRAAALRSDLDALECHLSAADSLLVPVWRDQVLFEGPALCVRRVSAAASLLDRGGELVFLGLLAERACFAVDVSGLGAPDADPVLGGVEARDLRFVAATLDPSYVGLVTYAKGMLYWHTTHQHCGRCGAPTAAREGGHMRECKNPDCAHKTFPRTDPAIIVLVADGERCLLGRQKAWPRGMYSTLAGFVEPGETLEQAAVREVREEAGVEIADLRYLGSQPFPFPASLMLGFMATAATTALTIDHKELEDARWFSAAELRNPGEPGFFVPGVHSMAGQLIAEFLRTR